MQRTTTTLLLAVLLAAVTTLAACGGDDDGPVTAEDLDGHTYVATGAESQELVADVDVRLTFADGFLNIDGGCNQINGAYTLDDTTLSWTDEPFGTLIGCEEALQAQDEWLTTLVSDGAEVALDGSELTLTGEDVTLELEQAEDGDTGEASTEQRLEGTVWLLAAIGEGDAFTERPGGVQAPTLQFEEGRALVFTGCNNGSAGVEITENTITFEPPVLTRVACEGESGTIEAAQTEVFDGEVAYAFDAAGLTLTKGDQSLAYSAG